MVIRNELKLKHPSLNTSLSSLVATYDYMFASLHPLTNFLSIQGGKLVTLDDGKIESTCLLKLCTFRLCIRISTENIATAASDSSETTHLFVCKNWRKPQAIFGKCACNPRFLYRLSLQSSAPGQHRCTSRSSMCRIVFSYTMAGIQHGDLWH